MLMSALFTVMLGVGCRHWTNISTDPSVWNIRSPSKKGKSWTRYQMGMMSCGRRQSSPTARFELCATLSAGKSSFHCGAANASAQVNENKLQTAVREEYRRAISAEFRWHDGRLIITITITMTLVYKKTSYLTLDTDDGLEPIKSRTREIMK